MTGAVLTLNAGSSSLKFSLYALAAAAPTLIAEGQVEGIGGSPHLVAKALGAVQAERRWQAGEHLTHEAFLQEILDWAERSRGGNPLRAVGHRIVHGGRDFVAPARLDDAVLARLDALSPMAPLHQQHNLAAVRAVAKARPDLAQIGCFDTAFHHGHAPEVDRFGLPRGFEAEGVRRYGFHGISYEFIACEMRRLDPALAAGRMIVAHLGNGASLCAIRDGRSIDTTMGLTALDGLVMGTRCGALDPGAILYLQQAHGMNAAAVEDMLYRRSGLLGVSGISGDMRDLLASDDARAREAIDLFVFRIVREIGALSASMGGLDGLVFTAGIGENAPQIRAAVCARLAWLGVALDSVANAAPGRVSAADSRLPVWAVHTDEEQMIAIHVQALLSS